MSNEVFNYQRHTTGESFDTSGAFSGEMQATSQYHSGVYRIENGEITHTPIMNSSQLETPKEGLEATAVKQSGFGNADLKDPNTLVTIRGVQATLSQFEELGILERNSDGLLEIASGETKGNPQEPVIQENPDEVIEKFHPDIEQETQQFIKAMHPTALSDALDQAVYAIVKGDGEVDIQSLANHSQRDVERTHDQLQKYLIANHARAGAIMEREGIPAGEHQAAIAWVRKENPLGLQKAVEQLLKNRNGNAIKKLVEGYKQDKWLGNYR